MQARSPVRDAGCGIQQRREHPYWAHSFDRFWDTREMTKQARLCPICMVRPANTVEDVMPQWTRTEALRISPPNPGQQSPARLTLRICKECNGQMGRLFEANAAQLIVPMMRGQSVLLDTNDQGIVGQWAIKTSLMFRIREAIYTSTPYESERRSLVELNRGAAPSSYVVRLARFEHDSDGDAGQELIEARVEVRNTRWQMLSTLGRLAIQVVEATSANAVPTLGRQIEDARFVQVTPPGLTPIALPSNTRLRKPDVAAIRAKLGTSYFQFAWGPEDQITRRAGLP